MSSGSHRRSGRRKSSPKVNKLARSYNIQLFKLFDPVAQSVLFIFFLYCLDVQNRFPYRMVLYFIVAWQVISCFINFLINDPKQLKIQRIGYLVLMSVYMLFFFYFDRHVQENFIALDRGLSPSLPVHQIILMTIAMVIAFWYNIICFSEFKTLLTAINKGR